MAAYWNVVPLVVLAPYDLLHLDQIDNALELVFGADGQLQRYRIGIQALFHLLYDAQEVGARAIHLVT